MITDYYAYLEVQRMVREQAKARAAAIGADTGTEAELAFPSRGARQLRHWLAEELRTAASRLDPAAA